MKTTPVIITIIIVAIGLCVFYWQYDETRRYNAAWDHTQRVFEDSTRAIRALGPVIPSPTPSRKNGQR